MSLRTGPSCSVNLEVLPRGMTTREFMKIKTQCSEREDPDDPFYVMNTKKLIDQYQLWVQTFPTIRPFYAVKCNDDPVLLSILAHLGTGFDCASKGEIRKILDLGVLPSDIIYANPCKQTSHIKYASKRNVSLMTFDNIFELYKVAANFNQSKLIVRICADDPNAICQLGAKFGCSVSEAYEMLHIAKELHLDVVGVSFHVGSGCQTPDAYRIALEMANDVFEYAESIGYQFTILDIGGGFPGSDKEFPLFKQLSTVINTNIVKLFGQRSDLHVIAEPGRFFASSCFSIAVQVTSKRSITSSSAHMMYYVNDGVYGSFNCLIYDHAIVEPHLFKDDGDQLVKYKSSIWGPTCDSFDKICEANLPELDIGDWLVFDDMGAYTMSAHSNFNGFKTPKIYYFIREEERSCFEEEYSCILTGRITPCTVKIYNSHAGGSQQANCYLDDVPSEFTIVAC